jgi:hypothetical protein
MTQNIRGHATAFAAAKQLPPRVLSPRHRLPNALDVVRHGVRAAANRIDTAQVHGPDVANELNNNAVTSTPRGKW